MSAQLASPNSFSAHLALAAGVSVTINAPSLADLSSVVARVQGPGAPQPANDDKTVAPGTAKASTPSPSPAPTSAPASAPAAAGGSASGGDAAAQPTYDDVKDRVLKLSKKSREIAMATLGQFKTVAGGKVDHGNKLQLPDYAAFIAAADKELGGA